MTYFGAKEKDQQTFEKIQITRFLDDWAYQANVRKSIRDDIKNLKNNLIKEKMITFVEIIVTVFKKVNSN